MIAGPPTTTHASTKISHWKSVPKEAKKPPLKKGKAAQLPANAVVEIQDSDIEDGDEPGATLVVWVLSGDADDEASRESQQALLSWPDQPCSQDAANFKKKLSGFEARAVDAAFALNHLGDAGIVSLASVAGGSSVDISARHFCRLKPRCLLTDEIVNVLMSCPYFELRTVPLLLRLLLGDGRTSSPLSFCSESLLLLAAGSTKLPRGDGRRSARSVTSFL